MQKSQTWLPIFQNNHGEFAKINDVLPTVLNHHDDTPITMVIIDFDNDANPTHLVYYQYFDPEGTLFGANELTTNIYPKMCSELWMCALFFKHHGSTMMVSSTLFKLNNHIIVKCNY